MMFEVSGTIEQPYDLGDDYFPRIPRWLKYIVLGLFVVIIILIIVFAPIRYWGIAGFACVNCFLCVVFAGYFVKKRTLGCLIPVISSGFLLLHACIVIIYFSIFYPDGVYNTPGGDISYFAGGVKYQLAIFLFLLVYFVSMSRFLRSEELVPQHPSMVSKYIGYLSLALFVLITCLHIFAVIVFGSQAPGLMYTGGSWGYRLHSYFQTLLFAVGVVITRLSRTVKMVLVVFLILILVFYSLLSSRGWAIMPMISIFCGLFFFGEVKVRTKVILLLVCIVALPWFALISNTVRTVLQVSGGKYEDIQSRLAVMKEWKSVAKSVPVGLNFFGRMFFTAGNVIVAYSPTQYPYKHLSPIEYAKEAAISMLPGPVMRFTGIGLDITKAQYTGTWMLRDYGMYVTETTSIEVSTIGSLWMLGGYIPVMIGGFLLALIHSFIAWIIRRAWVQNPDKSVFYFSVYFSAILCSHNSDLIQVWRTVLLQFVFAYFGFKLISPFLKIGYASEKQHEESVLGMY